MAMFKIKRALILEGNIPFVNVYSFVTESYIGLLDCRHGEWILIPKTDATFDTARFEATETLEELDDCVYAAYGEHIESVGTNSSYTFILNDAVVSTIDISSVAATPKM